MTDETKGDGMIASDEEIAAWAERHDLHFGGSKIDVRSAFEDAQTLKQAAQSAMRVDEAVLVNRHDLLGLLDGNLEAANIAIGCTGGIDFIEEHGGEESEDHMEQVAYHLYYTLNKAARLRDALQAAIGGKE